MITVKQQQKISERMQAS